MEPLGNNNSPLFIKVKSAALMAGCSVPTYYRKVAQGLMPKPVKLGARAVAWLKDEIIAVNQALVLGCSENEIKTLVQELHRARAVKFGGKHDVE